MKILQAINRRCESLTNNSNFEFTILSIIALNGVILGLETNQQLNNQFGPFFYLANQCFLAIFLVELAIKLIAKGARPWQFFKSGWNCFDFTVILLAFIPATGQWATLARLARLLRVLRIASVFPELRMIITTLMHSIPSMFHIMLLMGILFYVYAVAGFHLFHEVDPTHWRNLSISFLTLFRIATLEDWTDIMYNAMTVYPFAWAYFVSFVVLGTFVIINLFIAVVLNNLDEAKQEFLRSQQQDKTNQHMLQEIYNIERALDKIQLQLNNQSNKTLPSKKTGKTYAVDD